MPNPSIAANNWIPDKDKGPGWYINPASGRRKFEDLENHQMSGEMKAVNKALRDAGMPELWIIRAAARPEGERWIVTTNPDFKTPQFALGIGKDEHWSLPRSFYGLDIPNDPQNPVKTARAAQFSSWLARADINAILDKFPEFRPFAAAYAPVADRFLQLRAEQGMPSYLVNTRTGQTITSAEGVLEQWLRMVALQKGHADFNVPVRSLQEIAPYLHLQGDRGLAPFLDHYAQESKSWLQKNMPVILGGLSLVGLSPVAALGKGLGSALGSSIAGQAAAGAAASAALGGNPLQGALPALLGGAADKLAAAQNLGAAGPAASQALLAAAQGGNPLAAALASFAQQSAGQTNPGTGGSQTMSSFNLKDILASAAAGALTGGSAPTSAAAAAALQLLNGNTGLLPQNTGGDALAALIQGYAQSKLQGGQGAQGAAQGLGNMLADQFLSNGTLDDKLRETLGIPEGLGDALQGLLPQESGNVLQNTLQEWLRGKIADELNIPAQNTGGAPAAQIQQGTTPVDLLSLYQSYYNRLPAADTNYKNALDTMLASTQHALQGKYRDQQQALNADLNRRGLFSSGIALQQQGRLGEQFNSALADVAAQHALDAYSMQQAGEQSRRDQAWDMARTAASLAGQGAAIPAAMQTPAQTAAQADSNPLQTLARTILDRMTQQAAPAQTILTQQTPVQSGLSALGSALTAPLFTARGALPASSPDQPVQAVAAAPKPRFTLAAPASASGTASRRFTLTGASPAPGGAGKPFKFSYLG